MNKVCIDSSSNSVKSAKVQCDFFNHRYVIFIKIFKYSFQNKFYWTHSYTINSGMQCGWQGIFLPQGLKHWFWASWKPLQNMPGPSFPFKSEMFWNVCFWDLIISYFTGEIAGKERKKIKLFSKKVHEKELPIPTGTLPMILSM